jgi:outer membrane protein assembly factor BamB
LYGLSASTGERQWTYETGNMINGSPAVWADTVLFGGCDARFHVVRASDGTGLATTDVGSYIAASPAVADGRVYAGHYGGVLLCADAATGKILWEYANDERNAAFMSAPALASDRVLIGGRDGRLHAVERTSGKRLWTFRGRGDFDASPIVWGDLVAAATTRGMLYLVRLADGEEVWSHDLGAGIEASPAVADGRLVLACSDGRLVAFGRADGKAKP